MLKSLLLAWTLGLPALQIVAYVWTPNGYGPWMPFLLTESAIILWAEGLVVIGVLLYMAKPHRNV